MSYQFADIQGVRMHFDLQGEGEALVLIHAGIANLHMWNAQVEAFREHFQVLRYDVRGWGETADPPGAYTEHGDLQALLTHLGITQAHILGISNGGRIAIDFAIAHPEMVKKLIVVAPALGGFDYPEDAFNARFSAAYEEAMAAGDIEMAAEYEARLWVDGPQREPSEVEPLFRKEALAFIRHTLALPEGEGVGTMLQPPAAGRLDEIKAKTLIIFGDKDVDLLRAVADTLAREIGDVRRVEMADVAHLANMENPKRFNQIVLDFLLE